MNRPPEWDRASARTLHRPGEQSSTRPSWWSRNKRKARQHGGSRRFTSCTGGLAAALLLLLNGCSGRYRTPTTLHVVVVPNARMEWYNSFYHDALPETALLSAFRKLHPEVTVEISTVSEGKVEQRLRLSQSRGLGPDLLLIHAPKAISLLQQGLVDPLPQKDRGLQRTLAQVHPYLLRRARDGQALAGLPIFAEISLACYDRRRISQPPTSLSELLAVAAAGNPVGLSVDPTGLYWTAGGLGASDALHPILLPSDPGARIPQISQRQDLQRWLVWLRQSSLQGRVDVANGPQDLTLGLESGRLAWIPCFSPVLARLNRTMGHRLGVAPLPGGPQGPPSPFLSNRIWALGTDSSADQRRLALALAELSLDPILQREITLSGRYTIPANRYVPIPVASSGQLAAMATALSQFRQTAWKGAISYSQDAVERVLPSLESIVNQVMEGILTPDEGSEMLQQLGRRRP